MENHFSGPLHSKLKRKKSNDVPPYSANLYSNSLPSPPYSEENFSSSDEKEQAENALKSFSSLSQTQESASASRTQSQFRVHPNLSKVYPNLMGTTVKTKKKLKSNQDTNKKPKVRCYVCNVSVKEADMKEHLFFGPVECSDCGWVVQHCSNFSAFNDNASKVSRDCLHVNLKWKFNPINNFRKWLKYDNSGETSAKTFKKVLSAYIQILYSLKGESPWDKAINICNNFVLSNPEKLINPNISSTHKTKKCEKRRRKNIENIDLPSDGNYLIVREAIEECPNCYAELDSKDLCFNIGTWLIDITCKECGLYICFVLNPPDGSDPKIRILQH